MSLLFEISFCSTQFREEGKFSLCPFLSKSIPIDGQSFLSRDSYCFLFVSLCVLRTWVGYHQVGGSKIGSDRNVGCILFVTSVAGQKCRLYSTCGRGLTDCHQLAVELSESFFFGLPLGVALDLGRVVSFTPSLGMPLGSMGQFNTSRNNYYLSQLKPENI